MLFKPGYIGDSSSSTCAFIILLGLLSAVVELFDIR